MSPQGVFILENSLFAKLQMKITADYKGINSSSMSFGVQYHYPSGNCDLPSLLFLSKTPEGTVCAQYLPLFPAT